MADEEYEVCNAFLLPITFISFNFNSDYEGINLR